MTDNEIIKALKCCSETTGSECSECPLLNADCSAYDLYKLALDLINRKTDEVDNLVKELTKAEKALHKINHNSLCETETYKMGGTMNE